jgi:hypothetical protein
MPWIYWLWLSRQALTTPTRRTREWYECHIVAEFSGALDPAIAALARRILQEAL